MKITEHALNNLAKIAERVKFKELGDNKLPQNKIYAFSQTLKEILTKIKITLEKSDAREMEVEQIIFEGMQRLDEIALREKAYKEQAAKYLQEVVALFELKDELRVALYLWPISDNPL